MKTKKAFYGESSVAPNNLLIPGKVKWSNLKLRSPNISDIDQILEWENDLSNIEFSPGADKRHYSRQEIFSLCSSNQRVADHSQERWMITFSENNREQRLGCIDLYQYDDSFKSAWVGILVDSKFRRLGIATKSLKLLEHKAFFSLGIQSLCVEVSENNIKSLELFERANYREEKELKKAEAGRIILSKYKA